MNLKDIEKRINKGLSLNKDINYLREQKEICLDLIDNKNPRFRIRNKNYPELELIIDLIIKFKKNKENSFVKDADINSKKIKGNEVYTDVKSVLRTAYSRYTQYKNQREDVWQNECLVMDIHGLEIGDFLKPYYVTNEGVESLRKDSYSETLNELFKAINQRKVFEVQQDYNKRKKLIMI